MRRSCALGLVLVGTLALGGVGTSADAMPGMPVPAGGTQTIGVHPIKLPQPRDPQLGKLQPNADAATRGMFGPQVAWPIVPIHVALARNGRLISYGTPLGDSVTQGCSLTAGIPGRVLMRPRTRVRTR